MWVNKTKTNHPGYRTTVLKPDEVLQAIHIPFSKENQYFEAYKQARRREDDIAIVNAAVNVTFQPNSTIVSKISFGFGGMSFKTVNAPKTEEFMIGKKHYLVSLHQFLQFALIII